MGHRWSLCVVPGPALQHGSAITESLEWLCCRAAGQDRDPFVGSLNPLLLSMKSLWNTIH